MAAFRTADNGCYISPKLLRSPLFRFLLWKHGLDSDDATRSNQKYVDDLLAELRLSKYAEKAVLLGMDGVYDSNGRLDLESTDFLVGNDYVLALARSYPNEWFDPANRQYIPFYRKLAQHRVPFLSHVGYEFSLIGKDQSAGDPRKLRVPLDEGVTVIAAHGCSNGLIFSEPYYQTFLDLVSRYKNFYADVSALTQPNRFGMLFRLRRHPEVHDRLLFGTDYPLPVFYLPTKTFRTNNRFDRQYLVLKALGVDFRSFDDI